jgi:prophage DNA circulation protein
MTLRLVEHHHPFFDVGNIGDIGQKNIEVVHRMLDGLCVFS